MAEITGLFKATVKALKSRDKSLSGSEDSDVDRSIFGHPRKHSDFEMKAENLVKNITKLRDFLLQNRKEYVNAGSYLSSETSSMTDAERDQIDSDAQKIIKTCKETIHRFKEEASTQKVLPQVREHRNVVIDLIEKYLKVVCKIYSEQKAVRVKRVVDKKRFSRLEPERKPHILRSHVSQLAPKKDDVDGRGKNSMLDSTGNKETSLSSSNVSNTNISNVVIDERTASQDDDEDISPEEAQMFERENAALFDEMNSMVNEVRQIEGKVIEISRLQEIFADKVMEQEVDIDRIADTVVGSTENIKEANEEIREAMKKNAGFRVWILFFLVVCSLSLLFLDWYNS